MIYDKIKQLSAEKGVPIREVEQKCNLGKRSISNWNECSPSVKHLKAVADYFGVTVDELLREDA